MKFVIQIGSTGNETATAERRQLDALMGCADAPGPGETKNEVVGVLPAAHRTASRCSRTTGFQVPSSKGSCYRCGAEVKGRRRNGYCSDRCRMQDRREREEARRRELFERLEHAVAAFREDVVPLQTSDGRRQPLHAFIEPCFDIVFPRLLEDLQNHQERFSLHGSFDELEAPLCLLYALGSRSEFQELNDALRRRCELLGVSNVEDVARHLGRLFDGLSPHVLDCVRGVVDILIEGQRADRPRLQRVCPDDHQLPAAA